MRSTLVGHSGREYQRGKVLHPNPTAKDVDVYAAHCGDKAFVLKRLSPSIFAQWFYKHKLDLPGTHRILAPVDYNVEEKTVVYEYLKEDLLSLVQNNPDFPVAARKQILFEVGKALQELHAKNKIHIDVQPGHVMVDWSLGQQGQVLIERVALIDPGISMESSGDGLIRLPPFTPRLGNWWWRSPEGHTGQGIGKPSDLFSFGLVCIYTLTLRKIMVCGDEQNSQYGEFDAEDEGLSRDLLFFGPLCEGFLQHTADYTWNAFLRKTAKQLAGPRESINHLPNWQEKDYPNIDAGAKSMLLRIMNFDPAKRATIDEILEDPYWN